MESCATRDKSSSSVHSAREIVVLSIVYGVIFLSRKKSIIAGVVERCRQFHKESNIIRLVVRSFFVPGGLSKTYTPVSTRREREGCHFVSKGAVCIERRPLWTPRDPNRVDTLALVCTCRIPVQARARANAARRDSETDYARARPQPLSAHRV